MKTSLLFKTKHGEPGWSARTDTNLIVVTHKGGSNFFVEVHYGRYGRDVDAFDVKTKKPPTDNGESMHKAQREALEILWKNIGEDVKLQLTHDLEGPTATPRQRIYKMWFNSHLDYEGIGTPYEHMPDFMADGFEVESVYWQEKSKTA